MGETTADVRRDIELTRERMSDTLSELEEKVNVLRVVREHPWPVLGLAVGAGFLLARSKADVKATAATLAATGGASNKVAGLLDDLAARIIAEMTDAANQRLDGWVSELKEAIGTAGEAAKGAVSPGRRREREVARPVASDDARFASELGTPGGARREDVFGEGGARGEVRR